MTHFCEAFIEVGDDLWAGTYCKLPAGHDGPHSALYDDEVRARVVGARRICPRCDKPIYEDATEEERLADPPLFCSPLRCSAWKVIGRATPPHPITGARTMLRSVDPLGDSHPLGDEPG